MALDDWPTLSSMILHNQRVVMFLDYEADQTAFPWWLDEFSQVWETPFDPTDQSFPCTVQRPPGLSDHDTRNRLSLINHNLNVEVSLLGDSILVPAVSVLNITNNLTGHGSLGVAAAQCQTQWGRPPNFLNVDFYNYGGFPGSVFQVAADLNNVRFVIFQLSSSNKLCPFVATADSCVFTCLQVTYDRQCCGSSASSGAARLLSPPAWATYLSALLICLLAFQAVG
jgi:hypothetical protein